MKQKYYVRIYFKEDNIRFNAFCTAESKDEALRKVMNCERYKCGSEGLTVNSTLVEVLTKEQDIMNDFETFHRESDGRKMVRHLKYPRFVSPMRGYFLMRMEDIEWQENESVKCRDGIKALNECDLYLHRVPFTIVKD